MHMIHREYGTESAKHIFAENTVLSRTLLCTTQIPSGLCRFVIQGKELDDGVQLSLQAAARG